MPKLYLIPPPSAGTRIVAPRVYLDDVPGSCQVYLFMFSGHEDLTELNKELTKFGEKTGKNLFVGFWAMDDERYKECLEAFKLEDLPAIVITAKQEIAGLKKQRGTIYAKIDNKERLKEVDKMMDAIERIYNLFLLEDFKKAIKQAERANKINFIQKFISKIRPFIGKFLKDHKIELKWGPFSLTIIGK